MKYVSMSYCCSVTGGMCEGKSNGSKDYTPGHHYRCTLWAMRRVAYDHWTMEGKLCVTDTEQSVAWLWHCHTVSIGQKLHQSIMRIVFH